MLDKESILDAMRSRGHCVYEGEGVSQLQHAWQCGQLAAAAGAPKSLQLAAWLHDIGHLMTGLGATPTLRGLDDRHEALGSACLAALWGPAVSEPVRLHVQAKRYLVSTQPAYLEKLSADSIRSLQLQGGAMNDDECKVFQATPFSGDALRLRAWDDQAKRKDWFSDGPDTALAQLQQLMALQ